MTAQSETKSRFDLLKLAAVAALVFLVTAALIILWVRRGTSEARTLDGIRKSGVLRVLTTPESDLRGLQRGVTPIDLENAMLAAFADELGVTLQFVYVPSFTELPDALRSGKGDLIADNLTVTPEREKRFLFSEPFAVTREVVIAGAKVRELPPNPKLAVRKNSTYEKRAAEVPGARTTSIDTETDEIIGMVGDGLYDATIADDNFLRGYLRYRTDVHAVQTLPGESRIAWALPKSAKMLKEKLDDFIRRRAHQFSEEASTGDLDIIRERKMLRVLTRDNPVNYYNERGTTLGFEYENAKRFAESLGLQLVMVTPPSHDDLIPYLQSGRGDLIAASLTITPPREKQRNVVFCTPYLEVREVLVQREEARHARKLSELDGKKITVRKSSSYYETLLEYQKKGAKFEIEFAPPEVESVELLDLLADGKIEYTVIDNLLGRNARCNGRVGIDFSLALSGIKRYAWMVRSDNPQLKTAVDEFFAHELNGEAFRRTYNRYFVDNAAPAASAAAPRSGVISKYDALIREVAAEYYFDWRLIASQICQESGFDPNAHAADGGMGLMQIMPDTAKEMRCNAPFDPKQNLKAGTGYLARMRDRLDRTVPAMDRLYFALAAYNGGYGHLHDARILARTLKKDPNVWFDNVEEAMKLLSRKAYYSKSRYGYCRSDIIVRYVRSIRARYEQYRSSIPQ